MELAINYQPKQAELYRYVSSTGKKVPTRIGYGGALGGGKSHGIRAVMLQRRCELPGTDGGIIRRVYDDLKKNHIDPFFREYPDLRKFYVATDHALVLPNKSRILFMYAENEDDVNRKFTGIEFYDLFIDQGEQFSESEIHTMKTRVRWPNTPDGHCKFVLFFNPGGVGTEYLRRVFWLKQYKKDERPEDYVFIQAYGWDNYQWIRANGIISETDYYALTNEERFHLFITETQYGRELNALPPSLRAGHLLGSFEHFKGQYYAGVWDENTCVLNPALVKQLVRPWWTRWQSIDWGFAHHACHLWWTRGKLSPLEYASAFGGEAEWPVDVVLVYRCLLVNETPEPDFAMEIVGRTPAEERKLMQHCFLSPDAFSKKGSANTVAEQIGTVFRRYGMPYPELADNERVNGWRTVYAGLRQSSSLRGHNVDVERAKQGPLLFVSAECVDVISAIPLLTRSEKDPDDVEKTATTYDDVADCLRYGYKSMMAPRRKPIAIRAQEAYDSGIDLNAKVMALRIFKEKERKKSLVLRSRR